MKKTQLFTRLLLAIFIVFFFTPGAIAQEEGKESTGTHHKEGKEFPMTVEKHGNDTTIVIIHHDHHPSMDDFTFPFMWRKGKFHGHWAGVELGWNGYVNSNFNMSFPPDQRYLDLISERSLTVNLNPFSLNLNLVNNRFGLTSGLGFTINNYFFNNSTLLIHDSSELIAYKIVDQNGVKADMKTNKLVVSWLTVPVIFEYQTNSGLKLNSFHASLGVVGGVRIGSYTKQSFYSRYTTYYLRDDAGQTVGTFYTGNEPTRTHNQYHLNPFKLDVMMRVGWSFLNFYVNYTVTSMYQQNQGPLVYPWAAGITLLGW